MYPLRGKALGPTRANDTPTPFINSMIPMYIFHSCRSVLSIFYWSLFPSKRMLEFILLRSLPRVILSEIHAFRNSYLKEVSLMA